MTLTFSETIDIASLNVDQLTLHNARPATASHKLTTSTKPSASTLTVVLTLSTADVNEIQRQSICATQATCFLSFTATMVQDRTGNAIAAVAAASAVGAGTPHTADTTGPKLTTFTSFDLNRGELELSFDETVNASSLVPSNIRLISLFQNPVGTISMSGGSTTSANGASIVYKMSTTDVNNVKKNSNVCTHRGNCYVQLLAGAFKDIDGNSLQATTLTHPGFIVTTFVDDGVDPALNNFDLNMNTGRLVMTFNEPMLISSLAATGITLQSKANSALASEQYTLTGGSTIAGSVDDVVVTISLTSTDLDAVKALDFIKSRTDTFLSMIASTLKDTAFTGRQVTAIPNTAAKQVQTYTADTGAPTVSSFHLDLVNDQLLLTFSEPVRGSSTSLTTANLKQITLQNKASSPTASVVLTGGTVVTTTNGTKTVTITLLDADVRSLKTSSILGTSTTDTFFAATANFITDMAGVGNGAVAAFAAAKVTADTTLPRLVSWTLDVNSGQMSLTFDDVMNATNFDGSAFTIQDAKTRTTSAALTATTTTSSADGHVIVATLSGADLLKVKETVGLARNRSTSFLTMSASAIDDTEGNDVVAVTDGKGLQASTYTPDNTPPAVSKYSLDLLRGFLNVTFSDTVKASSLVATGFRIQSGQNLSASLLPTNALVLTGGTVTRSTDGKTLQIQLVDSDLNTLKSRTAVATSRANTFLVVSARVVQDSHDNFLTQAITNAAALQASLYTIDTTKPTISTCDFDANNGQLTLTFSEAVNDATFSATALTLRASENSTSAAERVTLTGGTPTTVSVTVIRVTLSATDLSSVKAIASLAKAKSSTFISATSSLVTDYLGNTFQPLTTSAGKQVDTYTADTIPPTLSLFTFDANSATLKLTFSEPIKASSVKATSFILRDKTTTTSNTYNLTGGTASTTNSDKIDITLSSADVEAVQKLTAIAVSNTTTAIEFGASAVTDMADVAIVASSKHAWSFFPDTTKPTLSSFSIDMDVGILTITFSEVTRATSIKPAQFVLQNLNESATSSFKLTSRTQTADSKVVNFTLPKADFDAIRANTALATARADSFLNITAGGVADMAGNTIDAPVAATQVFTYRKDTLVVKLASFELHLFNNTLELSFDDPVDFSKFDATRLTVQDKQGTTANTFTFTAATVLSTTTGSGASATVLISAKDAASLGTTAGVAKSLASTFLSHTDLLFLDTNGNRMQAIFAASALQASAFTADTGGPVLRNFDLNLNTGQLVMTFSEEILNSSLTLSSVTIQDKPASPTSPVKLDGGTLVSSTDAGVVTVTLTAADLNNIKKATGLGTNTTNTFVSAAAGYVQDLSSNTADELSAIAAKSTTADSTRPQLLTAEINLNSSTITLNLDEVVDPATLDLTKLFLQTAATRTTIFHQLTGGTKPTAASTSLVVTLGTPQLNQIKTLELCSDTSDCFVGFDSGLLTDTAGNQIVANDGQAVTVDNFTADTIAPTLAKFTSLDMDSGVMVISFDEPVLVSSLQIGSLELHRFNLATSPAIPQLSYVFTTSTATSTGRVTSLTLSLSADDLDGIKKEEDLCSSHADCFIRFNDFFISDVAGNNIIPVIDGPYKTTEFPETFTPDTTRPTLTAWSLDMDSNEVSLTFSESVDNTRLVTTAITLQSSVSSAIASRTLAGNRFSTITSPGTVMNFTFAPVDRDAIKAETNLAASKTTSYLAFTSSLIEDMARNRVSDRNISSGLEAHVYVQDTTSPTVVWFALLDLDTGLMHVGFNEPVDITGITFSSLTLQSTSGTPVTSYSLTGGTVVYKPTTNNKTDIQITLESSDVANLKMNSGLATTQANSFLVVGRNAVKDTSGSGNIASAALPVTVYLPDVTQPNLTNFTLDVDSGTLALTFDDVMDASSLVSTLLTLQSTQTGGTAITLTGGVPSTANGYTLTLTLTDADLDEIKLATDLGTQTSNTFIRARAAAARDVFNQPSVAVLSISALQAVSVTPDSSPPTLSSFLLNLTSNQLVLTFNKAMNVTSLSTASITVQNGPSPAAHERRLTGGTVTGSSDDRVLIISLVKADFNAIKLNALLGTTISNTYVSLLQSSVTDIASQNIAAIEQRASSVSADNVAPTLSEWKLDADAGTLTLTFDEPVNATSLNVKQLKLINTRTPTITYSLTDSISSTTDSDILTVFLSSTDLDQVKLTDGLATTSGDVFLSISPGLVQDVSQQTMAAVADSAATSPAQYTADATSPQLSSFSANMSDGSLSLTFNEPIRASSFQAIQLNLQNLALNPTITHNVSLATITPATNGRILNVALDTSDVNTLKRSANIATTMTDTFLAFTSTAFQDMAGRSVVAILRTLAQQASSVSADAVPPTLSSFIFNLNSGVLTMTFSESVKASTLDTTKIVLQPSVSAVIGADSVMLTGGVASTGDSDVITVTLSVADLNSVKAKTTLYTTQSNAFLLLQASAVSDTTLVAMDAMTAATQVTALTADTTSPVLSSYEFRMTGGKPPLEIVLNFDETVIALSFDATAITLRPSSTGAPLTLTGGSLASAVNSAQLTLQVSTADLASIRAASPLATTLATTFMTFTTALVQDMSNWPITARTNFQVAVHTADLIQPTLSDYSLDMDRGSLVLTYNETIQPANFSVTSVTLRESSAAGATAYTLTNSAASAVAADNKQVQVTLSAFDLNNLKINSALATNRSTTFLDLAANSIVDIAENQAEASAGKQATTFTADTTSPTVQAFDFNLTSKKFTIRFSEAVDVSTFDTAELTVQNERGKPPAESVKLTGGVLNSTDGTVLTFFVTDADRNGIQAKPGLATSRANTYMSLTVDFIRDHAGNLVNRITPQLAMQATTFASDSVRPNLNSWALNLNTGILSLTFDETIDVSTIQLSQFQLQDNSSDPVETYLITTTTLPTTDSATVDITLNSADQMAIKTRTLCTSSADCFASFPSSFASDAAGLTVIYRSANIGLQGTFIPDSTRPTILLFEEINLANSTLTISFDEPVNASTLDPTAITLQNLFEQAVSTYTLTGGSTTSPNGANIVVDITDTDLLAVQSRSNLCTHRGSCYLLATNSLVLDLNNRANIPQTQGAPGLIVQKFITDSTPPTISSYSLNMNTGVITLTFSEPVKSSDLLVTSLTLQSAAQSAGQSTFYALTSSTGPSTDGLTIVPITLSTVDREQLQTFGIGTSKAKTFLRALGTTVSDMAFVPNALTAIVDGSAQQVDIYTPDTTLPTLASFDLDLTLDQLRLTFSEPVQRSTLNVSHFSIHSAQSGGQTIALSGGSVTTPSVISKTATATFLSTDLRLLKLLTTVARNRNTTYLSAVAASVLDTSSNAIVAIPRTRAKSFIRDSTRPTLTSFDLDVSTGVMNLTFSDVVRASTFDATGFFIQTSGTSSTRVALTSTSKVTSGDGYKIQVQLSNADIFSVRSQAGLAEDRTNTFLTIHAHAIDDVYGVDVLAVTNGNGLQATNVVPDTTRPTLLAWDLDSRRRHCLALFLRCS